MNDALEMWTVYDHPHDYPEHYVARLWLVDGNGAKATSKYVSARTLKTLRQLLPPGLVRLNRQSNDDAKIVEVWLQDEVLHPR